MRFKAFIIFVLCLFAFSSAKAQAKNDADQAYVFAEIGVAKQSEVDRVIREMNETLKNPCALHIYIYIYGTATQRKMRRGAIARAIYWRDGCGIGPWRMTFIDMPSAKAKIKSVIWIVPPGARPPDP